MPTLDRAPPRLAGGDTDQRAAPVRLPQEPRLAPWSVSGHVMEGAARPVPGARVAGRLRRGSVVDVLAEVQCDDRGRYELDMGRVATLTRLQRAVAILTLVAEADGYLGSEAQEIPLRVSHPGEEMKVDLRLSAGSRIEGRVLDASGAPLPQASVTLEGEAEDLDAMASTDDSGSYSLVVRHAGRFRIVASWEEHEGSAGPFDVSLGVTQQIPDVSLPVSFYYVQGVVQRTDGAPVPRVRVFAQPEGPPTEIGDIAGATSNEAGEFILPLPTRGRHRLWPEALDGSADIVVDAGDRNVRVQLPACRLSVRVTTAEGHALPGAELSFMGWRASHAGAVDAMMDGSLPHEQAAALAHTVADGEVASADGVEVSYVSPESVWFVVARVPGGLPAEGLARVAAGQSEARIELVVHELDLAARLDLRVIGPNERNVAALSAHIETIAGTRIMDLASGAPGEPLEVPTVPVRLVVRPLESASSAPLESFMLPIVKILHVPTTGASPVRLQARLGGRFQLELKGTAKRVPSLGRGGVSIRRLDPLDATPRAIERWIEDSETGPRVSGVWRLGVRSRCAEVLEPGSYVLTVRPDALSSYESQVHIHPGATTPVSVAIDD